MTDVVFIDETVEVTDLDKRLDILEKYGIYKNLTELKNANPNAESYYTLLTSEGKVEYSYLLGDYTGKVNDITVIALNNKPVSEGALVIRDIGSFGYRLNESEAVTQTQKDVNRERISVDRFGAKQSLTFDSTDAFQSAINTARRLGVGLYVPSGGSYKITRSLNIPPASTNRGFFIYGDNSGNYYNESSQSSIVYTGEPDYLFKIVGSSNGDGSPMFVTFEKLRFIGNNSTPGAVLIQRSWYVEFKQCAFINFGNVDGGTITFKASGVTGFSGDTTIRDCNFANCGRNILFTGDTGGQVNSVIIENCKSVGQKHGICSDWKGLIPFTSDIRINGYSCQGGVGEVLISDGVASGWTWRDGYIEDSWPGTALRFNGANNVGITIEGINIRKSSLEAGNTLVYIINGKNCRVNGISGFGGRIDKYCVDFVACSDVVGTVFYCQGSVTPYPIRMNNYPIFSGTITDKWMNSIPGGVGLFNAVSSGDGWPGTAEGNCSATSRKNDGIVTVNFEQTVTKLATGGNSVLIGLFPEVNVGVPVWFDVTIKDASTGYYKFYKAKLPTNIPFATVYDQNGIPLAYSQIKQDSVISGEVSYATQS